MRIICILFVLVLIVSCRDSKGELNSKTETITLERVAFACDCADWVKPEYLDKPDFSDSAVFIDPADTSLILTDTLGYNGDRLIFTGQFYKSKGFSTGYSSIEMPEKAKVFRYRSYKVLKSNFANQKTVK